MDQIKLIDTLVKETNNSKVLKDVFTVFAVRERTRNQVNLTSLYYKMKKEGFSYSKDDYRPLLNLLASLGLGVPVYDRYGRVKTIKDIKATLQSIGRAAIKENSSLKNSKRRNRFFKLNTESKKASEPEVVKANPIKLQFDINGKTLVIPVPKDLDTSDIASLINKLKSA